MLTVCCVYVKGAYPYTVDYVVRLERMARRFLSRPFEFVCLADPITFVEVCHAWRRDGSNDGRRVVQIPSLAGVVPNKGEGHWNKVQLFNPARRWPGRVLYLDLDTLVVAPLDSIVDYPATFALTEDMYVVERAHLDTDRFGRRLHRRFNSSVMVWDGGTHSELWTAWSPAVAERLSTDQDWLGEQARDAQGMPAAWFPRLGHLVRDSMFAATGGPMPADAKVILAKKPKNARAADLWPWFEPLWGAA